MVNSQLVGYVKKQLEQGYNINSIKLNLARSGYTPEQIEAATGTVSGKSSKNLAKLILLVGGGAVILAAVITALIILFSGADEVTAGGGILEKDVGLQVRLENEVVLVGEDLKFEVKLVNLGSGINFGVGLRNEILDSGEQILEEEDILTLGIQEKKDYSISLDLDEGEYQLKTTIEYDGKEKVEVVDFGVGVELEEEDEITGADVLSAEAIGKIEDIKLVAETDFSQAKQLCLGLEGVLERDTCLMQTGLKINQEIFCPDIVDDTKRDSCYVNVAIALQNYDLCSPVVNQNLKEACLALR